MNIEQVKDLINVFNDSDLTTLKLKLEGFEVELGREKDTVYASAPMAAMPTQIAPVATAEVTINTEKVQAVSGHHVKSPMVGTFYNARSPQAKPFVTVGSKVKKGDIIGIIEAMKLMNEVEADVDGEVIEILVANEDMVEFDQSMFVIK